ncbi:hypothetical protein MMC25_003538 [Agyrium rufum]|nr:hypothetical protein [Agyrium rufum]
MASNQGSESRGGSSSRSRIDDFVNEVGAHEFFLVNASMVATARDKSEKSMERGSEVRHPPPGSPRIMASKNSESTEVASNTTSSDTNGSTIATSLSSNVESPTNKKTGISGGNETPLGTSSYVQFAVDHGLWNNIFQDDRRHYPLTLQWPDNEVESPTPNMAGLFGEDEPQQTASLADKFHPGALPSPSLLGVGSPQARRSLRILPIVKSYLERVPFASAVWAINGVRGQVRRTLRPKIAQGFRRVTWSCCCGEELYGDFADDDPQAVDELSGTLQAYQPRMNSARPNSTSTTPIHPHSDSRTPMSGTWARFYSNSQDLYPTDDIADTDILPETLDGLYQSLIQPPTPEYLELCINTGQSYQVLGEINVTHITSDLVFFAWVRKKYFEVRQATRARYRFSHFLVKPVKIQFVQFGLENGNKVHIFQVPSYPTETDVTSGGEAGKWLYKPCPPRPPPPMPSSAFIHYLRCQQVPDDPTAPGAELCRAPRLWLDKLPKKLHEQLQGTREPLAMAWGIHIVEGVDKAMVLWTMLVVLAVCLGPVVAYAVLRRDLQGATGIMDLFVSVLTLLWMAMKVAEQTVD